VVFSAGVALKTRGGLFSDLLLESAALCGGGGGSGRLRAAGWRVSLPGGTEMRGIVEDRLACQEGLCSMELNV